MIEALAVTNFKRFRALEVTIRPLTLLTGVNGMGKSTALQALLLLRQSYLQSAPDMQQRPRLMLNGDLVQLGTGSDVFNRDADTPELDFTLVVNDEAVSWHYQYDASSNALESSAFHPPRSFKLDEIALFSDEFQYLQAERLGPRVTYEMNDYLVREHRRLGTRGEYTVHFLDYWGKQHMPVLQVSEAMRHRDETSPGLIEQVTAWMQEISPGMAFTTTAIDNTDFIRLQISGSRPTNTGFGIAYTLPVVVALLSAQPGALILIENPEAHLHPRGQSRIGELMARAAAAGVQVLAETHSDHVLNAVRLAVKREIVTPDQTAVHFFAQSSPNTPQVLSPAINADGKLDQWPEGFFDEIDRTLDELLS